MPVQDATSGVRTAAPTLADLSEAQRSRRFAELQQRLPAVWGAHALRARGRVDRRRPLEDVDKLGRARPPSRGRYEERLLSSCCSCCASRGCAIIYVTSLPIDPSIIDYYLGLLAGRDPGPRAGAAVARRRARWLAAPAEREADRAAEADRADPEPDPRPGAVPPRALQHDAARARPRAAAGRPDVRRRSALPLVRHEDRLPRGCSPRRAIPHPFGEEDLDSLDARGRWAGASCGRAKPGVAEAIVKLNESASGRGNAVRRSARAPASGRRRRSEPRSSSACAAWRSSSRAWSSTTYMARLAELGGIVEERIAGDGVAKPERAGPGDAARRGRGALDP